MQSISVVNQTVESCKRVTNVYVFYAVTEIEMRSNCSASDWQLLYQCLLSCVRATAAADSSHSHCTSELMWSASQGTVAVTHRAKGLLSWIPCWLPGTKVITKWRKSSNINTEMAIRLKYQHASVILLTRNNSTPIKSTRRPWNSKSPHAEKQERNIAIKHLHLISMELVIINRPLKQKWSQWYIALN